MIAYIINGKSFGNCVDYVTRRSLEERLAQEQSKQQKADEKKYEANKGKDIMEHLSKDWKLIAATGDVRIFEGRKAMAEDIARPTKMRKSIKDPVGHISLDFHPKDAPMMTDDLMAGIAQEYMSQMGMLSTPFIVVRHYDKEHPHCHIVFSRVDNEKRILTQITNFKRNERVCKAINRNFGLNTSKGKMNTNGERLRGREKTRYEIFNICSDSFRNLYNVTWQDFVAELKRNGVTVEYKFSADNPDKVTGLFYIKDGKRFPSSKIDRRYTYYGICNALKKTDHLRIKPQSEKQPSSPVHKVTPQPLASQRSSHPQSKDAAIALSRPSTGGAPVKEQGFAHGGGVSDDFKRFLERHPDLSFDEALRRFKDEQKAKQRRKGPRIH